MHLRQLGRSSARGTWLIIAVLAALIVLRWMWGTDVSISSSYGAHAYGSQLLGVIVGSFLLYWLIALQMGALASDGRGHPPEWHTSPLSNSAALTGIMVRAIQTALIPLGFLVVLHFFDIYVLEFGAPYYWTVFGLHVLRLPIYALFAGCLMLALRRSPALPYLPMAIAIIATLCEFWSPGLLLHHSYFSENHSRYIAFLGLALGFVAQFILALWLIWLSSRERAGTGHYFTALLLLGGAGILSVLSMVDSFSAVNVEGLLNPMIIIPLLSTLGSFFPSLCFISPATGIAGDTYYVITLLTHSNLAVATLAAAYLVVIPVWWRAAIGCLRAARNPVEARWTK